MASDLKVESTIGVRFRQLKEKTVEEVAKVYFLISRQLLKVNSLKFINTFSWKIIAKISIYFLVKPIYYLDSGKISSQTIREEQVTINTNILWKFINRDVHIWKTLNLWYVHCKVSDITIPSRDVTNQTIPCRELGRHKPNTLAICVCKHNKYLPSRTVSKCHHIKFGYISVQLPQQMFARSFLIISAIFTVQYVNGSGFFPNETCTKNAWHEKCTKNAWHFH